MLQHTTEMGLRDGDQILGDFPCGEETQLLASVLVHPARGKIIATRGTGSRDTRETIDAYRIPSVSSALSGLVLKYGGCFALVSLAMMYLMCAFLVSVRENAAHGSKAFTTLAFLANPRGFQGDQGCIYE